MAIWDFIRGIFGGGGTSQTPSSNSQLVEMTRPSSCFSSFEFNTATGDLYVTFAKDGSSYTYHGVSLPEIKAVLGAGSQGQAFNAIIRNSHSFS